MSALGRVPTDFEERQEAYQSTPEWDAPFTTLSCGPVRPIYTDGGIRGGTVRSDVDVRAAAGQSCSAIIGMACTWLVSPACPRRGQAPAYEAQATDDRDAQPERRA
jgi:hypothetical protein